MLLVNFDRILLLSVYSNSFIFGTGCKGWLLLALCHRAREASGASFAVKNGEVSHQRLQSQLTLLLNRELCTKLSENGTYRKEIYLFFRKVVVF